MGPNGAGKTTLLRLCATLVAPSAGDLRVFGIDPASDGPAVRATIAYLGHESQLYGDLNAIENLNFTARLHRVENAEAAIAVALERCGLVGASRRPVRTYSRGMQQRCALARVLLLRPRLLLLDEPSTGLDSEAKATLHEIVTELRRAKTTVVLTTHDSAEAVRLCEAAAVLSRGRVHWHGRIENESQLAEQLAALPASRGGQP